MSDIFTHLGYGCVDTVSTKLPPTYYKPVIKRPTFDPSLPGMHAKRQPIIRGAGASRCVFCGTLLKQKEDICPGCGSTQISPDAEYKGKSIRDANLWWRRFKQMGIPKGGIEGV